MIVTEHTFTQRQLDATFNILKKIQIPAYVIGHHCDDGGYTDFEIGGYDGKAHYRWCCNGPEEWRPLQRFAQDLIVQSGITDRIEMEKNKRKS